MSKIEYQKVLKMYKEVLKVQLPREMAKQTEKAVKKLTLEEVDCLVKGGSFTITIPKIKVK